MASKIQCHHVYVAIAPYETEGQKFDVLDVMTAYDDRQKHFYVSLHAGWNTGWGGHGFVLMGGDSPLTASKWVIVKDAPRNSQKTIDEIGAAMELAKDGIKLYFDRRLWPQLYAFVKNVATYGYTPHYQQEVERLTGQKSNNSNNQNKEDENMRLNMNAKAVEIKDDVDVQEVDDIKPKVVKAPVKAAVGGEATTIPLGKHGTIVVGGVPKPKADAPQTSSKVQDSVPATAKLTYATYEKTKTNKTTGKEYTVTHGKIMGFTDTDEAYQRGVELHGAASGEMADGKKVLCLYFSHRYAQAARLVCDALNGGKSFDECKAIIDAATEENAKKREEWKAKTAEWKQKREERKAAKDAAKGKPAGGTAGTVAAADAKEQAMFELFKKFMAGDKDAMAAVGAMVKQAA